MSTNPNIKTFTGLSLEEASAKLDKELPADAYKKVPGGANLTDINPNYMRMILNEVFGMCGFGWGYDYDPIAMTTRNEERTKRNGTKYSVVVAALTHLTFWYRLQDDTNIVECSIPASGASDNSSDAYSMKGAITNAIGNAVSNIGFQLSVYLGKRDHMNTKRSPEAAYADLKQVAIDLNIDQSDLDDLMAEKQIGPGNIAGEYTRICGLLEQMAPQSSQPVPAPEAPVPAPVETPVSPTNGELPAAEEVEASEPFDNAQQIFVPTPRPEEELQPGEVVTDGLLNNWGAIRNWMTAVGIDPVEGMAKLNEDFKSKLDSTDLTVYHDHLKKVYGK
jgi:hypothetical protein